MDISGAEESYQKKYADFDEKNVVKFMISDVGSPAFILFAINNARENARTIRDVIPREAWEHINAASMWVKEKADRSISKRNRF